jgi:anti-sigma regulatory factor (Ser/Thr protein kinase)
VAGFAHEALMYEGAEGFSAGVAPFVAEGLAAGEDVMVAVGRRNTEALRDALGDDASGVRFVDMEELGRNPGRIISAWADFVADGRPGAPRRGIGEPVWPGRSQGELLECQLHESLINVAFADAQGFRLLCPYDRAGLDDQTLHAVGCSHPVVHGDGAARASYRAEEDVRLRFSTPLPPPRGAVTAFAFERGQLDDVRALVAAHARTAGLDELRAGDIVLAVNEAAVNSICHGGGRGVLRAWREDGDLVFEVRDRGVITDPLVGRRRPAFEEDGGWGLYVAHHVCDLVHVRSGRDGTTVRLHMHVT